MSENAYGGGFHRNRTGRDWGGSGSLRKGCKDTAKPRPPSSMQPGAVESRRDCLEGLPGNALTT